MRRIPPGQQRWLRGSRVTFVRERARGGDADSSAAGSAAAGVCAALWRWHGAAAVARLSEPVASSSWTVATHPGIIGSHRRELGAYTAGSGASGRRGQLHAVAASLAPAVPVLQLDPRVRSGLPLGSWGTLGPGVGGDVGVQNVGSGGGGPREASSLLSADRLLSLRSSDETRPAVPSRPRRDMPRSCS